MVTRKTIQMFIVVFVLFVLAVFAYGVLFARIQSHVDTLAVIQGRIAESAVSNERLQSARTLLRDISGDAATIDGYFIAPDGVVDFLDSLETLGKETDAEIQVSSVDLGTLAAGGIIVEQLHVGMTIHGSWQEVYHFISLVESMPLYLSVRRLSLDRQGTEWQGFLDISFGKRRSL